MNPPRPTLRTAERSSECVKNWVEAARQQLLDPPALVIIRSVIGPRAIGFREAGRRNIPCCSPKKVYQGEVASLPGPDDRNLPKAFLIMDRLRTLRMASRTTTYDGGIYRANHSMVRSHHVAPVPGVDETMPLIG